MYYLDLPYYHYVLLTVLSVDLRVEANEVRASSLCGEGLSGMPDEQPRRRALACPHSSLSGLGIPPSFLSGRLFRRRLPLPH